ncbi:MAG: prolyl oligopeptidase family serine peptidase [Reichenbachiella sp.]
MNNNFKYIIGLVFLQVTSGYGQNLVSIDSSYLEKIDLSVANLYPELSDFESEILDSWLDKQDSIKFATFKKTDFKKLNSKLYHASNGYERETYYYKFELNTFASSPPILQMKAKNDDGIMSPIIRCSKLKRYKNDAPSIENYWVSPSQKYLVAAISHSGSDWLELLVYDLASKKLINEINGVINGWLIFHKNGFYYERYDEPENGIISIRESQRILYHQFESDQDKDQLVFFNSDKTSERTFDVVNPKGSTWIIVHHPVQMSGVWHEAISLIGIGNSQKIKPILIYNSPVRLDFEYVYEDDSSIYFRTDFKNPNFAVVKLSIENMNQVQVVVPSYSEVLVDVEFLENGLFGLTYLDNGFYEAQVWNDKFEYKWSLPIPKGSGVFFAKSDEEDEFYVGLTSFHLPTQYFTVDTKSDFDVNYYSGRSLIIGNEYVIEIEIVRNEDGVDIPVYIISSDSIKRDSNNPILISVYGGYGVIQHPQFDWKNHFILENGGVLVIPGVRGSGVKGSNWAREGRGGKKQNTIDDVHTVAKYMINEKYTKPELLYLEGGSHGGFVVAAAAIQKPELYGGVIANAGVYDLIEGMNESVGHAQLNVVEYGDSKDSVTLLSRYKLSPIHNVKSNVNYPSFLLITGTNDTRVSPSNSYRFLACLQDNSLNDKNFLHVTNGGHSISNYSNESTSIMSIKLKYLHLLSGVKFWK